MALGLALRGVASSAIDVSDGLLGDLGHILKASGVGACVDATVATNLLAASARQVGATADFDAQTLMQCALAGGDDYELVFTAPPAQQAAVQAAAQASGTRATRIGRVEPAPGLRVVDGQGQPVAQHFASFDHFA